MTEPANDFRYANLNEVDPNFELLDPEVYTLRISKAELRTYLAKTANPEKGVNVGDERAYVNFTFTVINHPKFSGRKHFESLFPSNFSLKTLRKIADATGVAQAGTLENWLTSLSSIQPAIKLKVDKVEDLQRVKGSDGEYTSIPNPATMNSDGTPSMKNTVDWKAGVLQAE